MAGRVTQIFISYAHLDNSKPEGYEMGWVDRLFNALEIELPTHGVEVNWWRDKRDLNPESYFDESILKAVENSDAFLAVLSPAYPQRPFCIKELTHFLESSITSGDEQQRHRVLKVIKRPIVDPDISRILPHHLEGSGEFRFYTIDRQTKRIILFVRNNGEIVKKEFFWDTIEELAVAISRTVKKIKLGHEVPHLDVAVYVAEPSGDLEQSHRTIRSELRAKGFRVLPDGRIPDDYHDAVSYIDDQLSRSAISIHLLGERSGYIPYAPDGEPAIPITRLQLARADVHSKANPAFRRFIWARQDLKPSQPDQQNLIAALEQGTLLLPADEFVREPLELFKNVVLDQLGRRLLAPAAKKSKRPRPILLITHPSDKPTVNDLKRSLHEAGYEVFTISLDATELEEETRASRLVGQVDAAVVLFTPTDEVWAQTILQKVYDVSVARDDNRPMVRAVLFRNEADATVEGFHSHYCNLVLRSATQSMDGAIGELGSHLDRALSS
jgi:hypothetical protein